MRVCLSASVSLPLCVSLSICLSVYPYKLFTYNVTRNKLHMHTNLITCNLVIWSVYLRPTHTNSQCGVVLRLRPLLRCFAVGVASCVVLAGWCLCCGVLCGVLSCVELRGVCDVCV